MIKKIFTTVVALSAALCMQAQDLCTVKGRIESDTLRYDGKKIKMVYLTRIDEHDRQIKIDSAKVKRGKYKFKYHLKNDEPVMMYLITGFDNGNIRFFMESGNVNITTESAAFPVNSDVSGTETNNIYKEYKRIYDDCLKEQSAEVESITASKGEAWVNSKEGLDYQAQFNARSIMKCNNRRLEYLLDNNSSPVAPLMMQQDLLKNVDKSYARQMVNAIAPNLHAHPYYRLFKNNMLALDLREGNELPDIPLQMRDGTVGHLSDYRGKFVLLDFWASWCNPCMQELKHIKQLYDETREYNDKFVIVSHSLDRASEAWLKTISAENLDREGWVHSCDLLMGKSPAARMMNVAVIPTLILVDPEGRAISFTLRGEETVARIKQILGGDLYYLQNDDKK